MTYRRHDTAHTIHRFAIMSKIDPGAVGAGMGWIDTNTDQYILRVRSGDDTEWITLIDPSVIPSGGGHEITSNGTTYPTRAKLEFQGDGWEVVDDPDNDRTIVRFTGGSSLPSGTVYFGGEPVYFGGEPVVFNGGA